MTMKSSSFPPMIQLREVQPQRCVIVHYPPRTHGRPRDEGNERAVRSDTHPSEQSPCVAGEEADKIKKSSMIAI